jgi:hypothetical protein
MKNTNKKLAIGTLLIALSPIVLIFLIFTLPRICTGDGNYLVQLVCSTGSFSGPYYIAALLAFIGMVIILYALLQRKK